MTGRLTIIFLVHDCSLRLVRVFSELSTPLWHSYPGRPYLRLTTSNSNRTPPPGLPSGGCSFSDVGRFSSRLAKVCFQGRVCFVAPTITEIRPRRTYREKHMGIGPRLLNRSTDNDPGKSRTRTQEKNPARPAEMLRRRSPTGLQRKTNAPV